MILAMKSLVRCILASGAIAVFSASGHAEDFGGPYAGVEAGYAITDVDGVSIDGPVELHEHAAVASGVVGYRMPVGSERPAFGLPTTAYSMDGLVIAGSTTSSRTSVTSFMD